MGIKKFDFVVFGANKYFIKIEILMRQIVRLQKLKCIYQLKKDCIERFLWEETAILNSGLKLFLEIMMVVVHH